MGKPATAHLDTPTKLVVRVLQDLVRRESFATYADLAEVLKCRCAQLKIWYHAGLIAEAIAQLERGGTAPLVPSRFPRRQCHTEPLPEPVIINRQAAAEILAALGVHNVRTPAAATWRDPEQTRQDYDAARARAYEMGVDLSLEDFLR